jgi:hypothetical protein
MSQIKGVRLNDYEDGIVMARTILDAAQDEEIGHITARPHILMTLSREGFVEVTREGDSTKCFVKIRKIVKDRAVVDNGSCEVYDPSGVIFEAAKSAVTHVKSLHEEYGR